MLNWLHFTHTIYLNAQVLFMCIFHLVLRQLRQCLSKELAQLRVRSPYDGGITVRMYVLPPPGTPASVKFPPRYAPG